MSIQVLETVAHCDWPGCLVVHAMDGDLYQAEDELDAAGWWRRDGDCYCPAHVDAAKQREVRP